MSAHRLTRSFAHLREKTRSIRSWRRPTRLPEALLPFPARRSFAASSLTVGLLYLLLTQDLGSYARVALTLSVAALGIVALW